MKLKFIPINAKKAPQVKNWQTSEETHNLEGFYGRGLVCGKLSDNLEAIDIDLKYDLTGTLFERFKRLVNDNAQDLLRKMTVQKTVSGGYHFIYRCSQIEGNRKLANRPTTEEERTTTYDKEVSVSGDAQKAQRARDQDKVRVLLETRGEGGYIAIVPTPGYELVYGTLETIQTISTEEREILFSCARQFNEIITPHTPTTAPEKKEVKGLTPFEDFNSRGDVLELLQKHGWTVVGRKQNKTILKRPGQTSSAHSGNFDHSKNWFSVFSTSTAFDPEKAYLPYSVFAVLECNNDYRDASKKLYDLGYGERRETAIKANKGTPSRVNLLDNDLSFVSTPQEHDPYLTAWRSGKIEMGKTTGIPELDKHFLFKKNSLVIVNGIDNVGKSTLMWYLALLSNLLHGWKWIIFSSENSEGFVVKKLIEFFWCESLTHMTEEKYLTAKKHIEENFKIIKSDDELYNYKDVLVMTKKLLNTGTFHGLLIDPYNSLKVESSTGFSEHAFHYEAISEMKLFTKRNNISIYINCHVITSATRTIAGQNSVSAPKKADTEQGSKFANKADDFLTIHRDVAHPDNWRWNEIHVRKIKETETGGRVTPFDKPILLTAAPYLAGFITANDINPVKEWHKFNPGASRILASQLTTNEDFLSEGQPIITNDEIKDLPF